MIAIGIIRFVNLSLIHIYIDACRCMPLLNETYGLFVFTTSTSTIYMCLHTIFKQASSDSTYSRMNHICILYLV